jgi:hypothetical protein
VQRGGDDLIRAIKIIVDRSQDRGQFILSGSARFLTIPTLSESLAGRAGFLDLWPLSLGERTGGTADFADRLFGEPSSLLASRESPWMRDAYLDLITESGYPEVLTIGVQAIRRSWYEGYLSTVIVRDIGDFVSLRDAEVIPKVLGLIAARSGSLMVHSDIEDAQGVRDGFRTRRAPAQGDRRRPARARASCPGRASGDVRAIRTREAPGLKPDQDPNLPRPRDRTSGRTWRATTVRSK